MTESASPADERFRAFMLDNLARAAEAFDAVVTREPRFGWYLRSASAQAEHPEHGACWLRVHSEPFATAGGDTWTGNVEAEQITGVAKPHVLAFDNWDDKRWGRSQRAELSTLISEASVSSNEFAPAPSICPPIGGTASVGICGTPQTSTLRASA